MPADAENPCYFIFCFEAKITGILIIRCCLWFLVINFLYSLPGFFIVPLKMNSIESQQPSANLLKVRTFL